MERVNYGALDHRSGWFDAPRLQLAVETMPAAVEDTPPAATAGEATPAAPPDAAVELPDMVELRNSTGISAAC